MSTPIQFFVEGDPKGQPRARACIRGKHAGVYDPGTADAWKMQVAEVWRNVLKKDGGFAPFAGGVRVCLTFYFRRPKSHFGSGKNMAVLKPSAPRQHVGKPDLDNLAKAVFDVLTRLGAWKDDAQVSSCEITRRWSGQFGFPGCAIGICEDNTP